MSHNKYPYQIKLQVKQYSTNINILATMTMSPKSSRKPYWLENKTKPWATAHGFKLDPKDKHQTRIPNLLEIMFSFKTHMYFTFLFINSKENTRFVTLGHASHQNTSLNSSHLWLPRLNRKESSKTRKIWRICGGFVMLKVFISRVSYTKW